MSEVQVAHVEKEGTVIKAITRSIRFYACGGTGINLLRSYRESLTLTQDPSAAEEFFSYIDTSIANLVGVALNDTFTLKGVDGSGSDRPKNAAKIMEALPDILVKHPSKDMNIVLFSSAGGTGSVAGPLMVEELLRQGKMVIAIIVGSHETTKRTTNTIGTLQGLELAVERVGRPIVMYYHENDLGKSIADNNLKPKFVMTALTLLGSGRNTALDSSDIQNMFDYHTVTQHTPGLAMLDVLTKVEEVTGKPISYNALLRDETQLPPAIKADYDKTGYLPADSQSKNNFYFTVGVDHLSSVFDNLNKVKDDVGMQKKVIQTTTKLASGVQASATGLVF